MNSSTEPSEMFFIIVFSFTGILILIGTVISLIIIICVSMNNTLQSVSTLLSCNSCALGLFYFIFHTFYIILAFYPLPTYRQNSILCQIIGYLYSVTCCGISWSHAILASNRLCYSLFSQYRWLLTYTFAWCLIAIHWILTFTLPFPFIFFDAYQYQYESRICILTTKKTSTSLMGVILFYNIPFTVTIIVYILVWCHARRSNNTRLARNARNLAIMRHILTLVIIDTICGHPYITLILLDYLGKATKEWYLFVSFFITLSVTANMCAIFIFNRKLRKMLCSKWIDWRGSPSNTSTTGSAMIPMRISTYIVMSGNIMAGISKSPVIYHTSANEK
ncbi:unnamed protein product [Adineta steineri]|uniref:G-protein coupled receptors family 1 profile domain-containing protein n=1 Tax=Adineta steineri TaxID=433720 RepID=A0A813YGB4_9BILA|nr:unnamed protein product [Adineta steineri]